MLHRAVSMILLAHLPTTSKAMPYFRFVIVLLFSLNLISVVNAQHYYAKHLTTNDGLPSNAVRVIFKDSRNTLWVGTDAGLCTYNGKEFKKITIPGNSCNRVWALTEDDKGNLWIGTYGSGLFKYDGEKTIKYSHPQIPNNFIRIVKYSKKFKQLLIGTEKGFCVFKDSTFKSYYVDSTNHDLTVRVMDIMECDNYINYYTFISSGYKYLPKEEKVIPLPTLSAINNVSVSRCLVSENEDTILGINRTGIRVVSKNEAIEYDNMGQIFGIQTDKQGNIWCAAWSYTDMKEPGGFFVLTPQKKLLSARNLYKIDDRLGFCVLTDKQTDAVYLGTEDNGMYILPNNAITYYGKDFFGADKLGIYDLIEKDCLLWISMDKNIAVGNPQDGFKVCDYNYIVKNSKSAYNTNEKITVDGIHKFKSIVLDSTNQIWISSKNYFFKVSSNLPTFRAYSNKIPVKDIFYIEKSGFTLAGGWGYFYELDDINKPGKAKSYLTKNYPNDINRVLLRNGEYWITSNYYGLYKYKDRKPVAYSLTDSLIPTNLNDIVYDGFNNIILGTNDGKILILDLTDGIKTKFELSEKEGIVGTTINWLLCTKENKLWIGTNKGINIIDLENFFKTNTPSVKFINADEGLTELNVRKAIEDNNGNIWLGGTDNLVKIEPDKLFSSLESNNSIKLLSILVNNKTFNWGTIAKVDSWSKIPLGKISLSHNLNSLVFRFASTNHINPDKDLYSVKLVGFDEQFSEWNNNGVATYTNLPPNKYKLIVKAKNIGNQTEYSPISLDFTISPSWWQTWWAYTLLALIVIVLTYSVFKIRINKIKNESTVNQRISELKLEALKAQMNPHFIFNAFTFIQLYLLQNDSEKSMKYMGSFSKLIRKTLDNSTKKTISLVDEIEYLDNFLSLEQQRNNNFTYTFKVSPEIDKDDTYIPPMLIQPLVENAIMHGIRHLNDGTGKLLIGFEKTENNFLKCIVEDNGIGRTKSKELYNKQFKTHDSKGSVIIEERIKLLNLASKSNNISIAYTDLYLDGKPAGTRVELIILSSS